MKRIRADRWWTVAVLPHVAGLQNKKRTRAIPVLMYHSVSTDAEKGVADYYRVTTSPARFREQMQYLHSCGYQALTPAQAMDALFAPEEVDRPSVVITFDDGFRDFLEHAWPVLRECNYCATVYLPTDYISRNRKFFKDRECMTWAEIALLHEAGICFGSHTASHPRLYGLSREEIRSELRTSRNILEDHLGSRVEHFAYPFGYPEADPAFCNTFEVLLREEGYRSCVTTRIGRFSAGDSVYAIRRLPVNDADDLSFFQGKLEGRYDWMGSVQLAVKRLRGVRT